MDELVTLLKYEFIPSAVWSNEDRVYYPHVRSLLNGLLQGERQYVMGFEDEATALVFAKEFANEEMNRAKLMSDAVLRSLRIWNA